MKTEVKRTRERPEKFGEGERERNSGREKVYWLARVGPTYFPPFELKRKRDGGEREVVVFLFFFYFYVVVWVGLAGLPGLEGMGLGPFNHTNIHSHVCISLLHFYTL